VERAQQEEAVLAEARAAAQAVQVMMDQAVEQTQIFRMQTTTHKPEGKEPGRLFNRFCVSA